MVSSRHASRFFSSDRYFLRLNTDAPEAANAKVNKRYTETLRMVQKRNRNPKCLYQENGNGSAPVSSACGAAASSCSCLVLAGTK